MLFYYQGDRNDTQEARIDISRCILIPALAQAQGVRFADASSNTPREHQGVQADTPQAEQENHYTVIRVNNGSQSQPYSQQIRYASLLDEGMQIGQIGFVNYVSTAAQTATAEVKNLVRDPRRLYVWQRITGGETAVTRLVQIRDQFGERAIETIRAEWLVCPAEGRVGSSSVNQPSGQYYKAYRVAPGPGSSPVNQDMAIEDGLGEETINVKRLRWLLVPVHVWRDNAERPILNSQLAFTCYLAPSSREITGRTFETRSMFSALTPVARFPAGVMIPTQILKFKVID